jgi:hypothetical protein
MLTSMKPLQKMGKEKITSRGEMKKEIELFKQLNIKLLAI